MLCINKISSIQMELWAWSLQMGIQRCTKTLPKASGNNSVSAFYSWKWRWLLNWAIAKQSSLLFNDEINILKSVLKCCFAGKAAAYCSSFFSQEHHDKDSFFQSISACSRYFFVCLRLQRKKRFFLEFNYGTFFSP